MDVFFYLLSRSRLRLALAVAAGVMSGLGSAGLLGLINAALHASSSAMGLGLLVHGGLGILVLFTRGVSTVTVSRLRQLATRDLRMELSRRIIGAPLRLLQELGTPRLMANLTEDVSVVASAFQLVPHLCINVASVLGCLVYLAWLSWGLFVLVVGVMAFGVMIYRLSTLKAMGPLRAAREQDDALYAHFRALTQGIKEIKLHRRRRGAFLAEVLAPTAEACCRSNVSAMTVFILGATWGSAVFYFLIGMILYGAPQWWEVTGETVTGYTLTILYMMAPLGGVIDDLPALGRASIALGKIDCLKRELADRTEEAGETATTRMPVHPGPIELIGVTHRYLREGEDHSFTLGPLNLVLKPGEVVFLTGGNGSGKSTLALLLVGLYSPERGQISLNGEVISDANREEYRQQFSVIFSDFYLFESLLGLVESNLDERARGYLAQLQLDRKVTVADGVFSTLELSQGQRKRLALLTAYLEDRPFYVFDEWAADQDPLFKELFYTVLLSDLKARGKTVVVITHDDHYYHVADRCIRLEDGRIVEDRHVRPKVEEGRTVHGQV